MVLRVACRAEVDSHSVAEERGNRVPAVELDGMERVAEKLSR